MERTDGESVNQKGGDLAEFPLFSDRRTNSLFNRIT